MQLLIAGEARGMNGFIGHAQVGHLALHGLEIQAQALRQGIADHQQRDASGCGRRRGGARRRCWSRRGQGGRFRIGRRRRGIGGRRVLALRAGAGGERHRAKEGEGSASI